MTSATDLLASIDAAILAFLTDGAIQQYTIANPGGGSRTVMRSQLGELKSMRDALKAESASAQSGGTVNYFRRGMA